MPELDLDRHLTGFAARIVRDAYNEATALYWMSRAETFENARPKAGDYRGQASLRDIDAADRRCREAAEACRRQAALCSAEWGVTA